MSALMKVASLKACLLRFSHNTRVTNCQANNNLVKEMHRMGPKSKQIIPRHRTANLTVATVAGVKMSMVRAEANLIASLCSSSNRIPKVLWQQLKVALE